MATIALLSHAYSFDEILKLSQVCWHKTCSDNIRVESPSLLNHKTVAVNSGHKTEKSHKQEEWQVAPASVHFRYITFS